jgi:hypothetical protein
MVAKTRIELDKERTISSGGLLPDLTILTKASSDINHKISKNSK